MRRLQTSNVWMCFSTNPGTTTRPRSSRGCSDGLRTNRFPAPADVTLQVALLTGADIAEVKLAADGDAASVGPLTQEPPPPDAGEGAAKKEEAMLGVTTQAPEADVSAV